MAEETVTLADGIKIGEHLHKTVVLRPPTAGDLLDAQADAERAVLTPTGYELLVSNSAMAVQILRRQVRRIGADISGPLELAQVRTLSTRDLDALYSAADRLDIPLQKETEQRGRDAGAGEGSRPG